ncbi:MAG: AAA family ATPase [Gaiellaceae bacterium]
MRIAITGPAGSGKTTLAAEIAHTLGIRHIEIDALHHGPNWESCGEDVLRERVLAAIEGDGWVTDSTYHGMLGNLVSDRADILVWLDLPVTLVMWRLLRRTHVRNRDKIELWNGNLEPGWRESMRNLIWPALRRAFANRREFPERYAHLRVHRLRSDSDVRAFVRSIRSAEPSRSRTCSAQQWQVPP